MNTIAWIASGVFVLVFPVYHAIYPLLARMSHGRSAADHVDTLRHSWIEWLLEGRRVLEAAQTTRNLTMVNTLLASSALILFGFTANIAHTTTEPQQEAKLYLLMVVFAMAFSFFVSALRHIGYFNLTIGADPKLIEEREGPPVEFFAKMIARASHRYTLGVRTFHSAFPLFLWMASPWLFLGLTTFWAVKFVGFPDFGRWRGGFRGKA